MSFNKEGFLSPEIESYKKKIFNDNIELFNLCFEANKFGQKFKHEINIHNQNVQEMMLGCLLIKLLNNFQSILILSNHGLIIESKILLRAMIELMFILKACCDDSNFVTDYIMNDLLYRKKLLNVINNNPNDLLNDIKKLIPTNLLKKIKQNIKVNNVNELKIEQIAKKVGLHDHYETAYRMLCNPVHSGARSLEEYLILDSKKEATTLNFGPIEKGIDFVLITTIDTLCIGLLCIAEFFRNERKEEIENFRKKALAIIDTNSISK